MVGLILGGCLLSMVVIGLIIWLTIWVMGQNKEFIQSHKLMYVDDDGTIKELKEEKEND